MTEALTAHTGNPSEHGRLQHLFAQATELYQKDSQRCLEVAREAAELARQLGDSATLGSCLIYLGFSQRELGQLSPALSHYQEARQVFSDLGDRAGAAKALNELGAMYGTAHDDSSALECFEAALPLWRELGNVRGEASSLNNLANVYANLGQNEAALETYQQSLALYRQIGHQAGEAVALCNISDLYCRVGWQEREQNPQAAAEAFGHSARYAAQSIETARAAGDPHHEALALRHQASASLGLGYHEQALAKSWVALEQFQTLGLLDRITMCLFDLGSIYYHLGQYPKAITYLERSRALAEEKGFKFHLSQAYERLSQVYEARSDYAQALACHRKFHALTLALRDESAERRAQVLAAKLEVEKTRHEADLHRLRSLELESLNERLQSQAQEDPLTGLPNRRLLASHLTEALLEAQGQGSSLSVAMADVDHFKRINDRFSHLLGDQVLKAVAEILRSHCRSHDLAARYGGEEFTLVLNGATRSQAFEVCERLRLAVQNHDWTGIHPDLKVTMSFGLADNSQADSPEEILAMADQHLYQAKKAGRNWVWPSPA
jgi:diguanylate cyclase (GGDEF)-like protein